MSPTALQDRSERLASLIGELGAALRDSGIAPDTASRVLENASAAVLDALTLELMFSEDPPPRRVAAPVQESATPPSALPLAA